MQTRKEGWEQWIKSLAAALGSQDILLKKAVFSDETENYVKPFSPKKEEPVSIYLRTAAGNVDEVFLCFREVRIPMAYERTEGLFDYYKAEILSVQEVSTYWFCLMKGNREYLYNKNGVTKTLDPYFHFRLIRNFSIPDWAKGAPMYQIFTDRFYNGDMANDVKTGEYFYLGKRVQKIEDWFQTPQPNDTSNFYGGDLQGVIEKLDYLQELGIEAIYFNPLFVSPSNHKYDTQDYDYIDPHLGKVTRDGGTILPEDAVDNVQASMYGIRTTERCNLEASNALFIYLVEEAHKRGIRVILDGVFNHCGAFHKWMDMEGFYARNGSYAQGAYEAENSPYHGYFKWLGGSWPNNDDFDGWWGYKNHPKLYYENDKNLMDYILKIGAKWVSPPFCADGWRLDVGADLGYSAAFNHQFWQRFRNAVKTANPQAVIIAEHYGDASSWLDGEQWDTIMNYDAFMEPVSWFFTGMEKHSDQYREDLLCNTQAFMDTLKYNMARLSMQSLMISMNQLSNHDHSRFLTRTNRTVGRLGTKTAEEAGIRTNEAVMREAVLFQMTWIGCPTVYYGDEAGLCGWTDPDNRRTYPWGRENMTMLRFHQDILHIRKQYKTLRTGSVKFLASAHGAVGFGRFDNMECFAVAVNNNSEEALLRLPVWQIGVLPHGIMESLLTSYEEGYTLNREDFLVEDGILEVTVPAYGGILLREKKNED